MNQGKEGGWREWKGERKDEDVEVGKDSEEWECK